MTIPQPNLRPLKAGEILDRAFRLYRRNFGFLIGITGGILILLIILDYLGLAFFFEYSWFMIPIQSFLIRNLLEGAVIWAVSRRYHGIPTSIADSYRQTLRRFWSVFGASFLQSAVSYLPAGILVIIGGVNGCAINMFLAIAYSVFLSTRWGISICVIILEKCSAMKGLTRSWSLTSKDSWHVFVTLLASILLVSLAAVLPKVAFEYATAPFQLEYIGSLLSVSVTLISLVISFPLSMSVLVILYYDLRVRREGYDLEWALQTIPETPETPVEQLS